MTNLMTHNPADAGPNQQPGMNTELAADTARVGEQLVDLAMAEPNAVVQPSAETAAAESSIGPLADTHAVVQAHHDAMTAKFGHGNRGTRVTTGEARQDP